MICCTVSCVSVPASLYCCKHQDDFLPNWTFLTRLCWRADFAGGQSWSFILDKTEYNLHPKDSILTAMIYPLLRNRSAKTSAFGELRRYSCPPWDKAVVAQGLLGGLVWCLWGEQVSKGSHSCFTGSPPALPFQPGCAVECCTVWSQCHLLCGNYAFSGPFSRWQDKSHWS